MSQAASQRDGILGVFQASRASATRLVHLIPDQLADEVPEHVLFAFAKTPRPEDGFVEVTARQFAAAVNRASWFLQDVLGPARGFGTVGYMGSNDLRYFFLMFGAIKVGYKMLFLSPKNTLDGHLNVLDGADCHIFLSGEGAKTEDILLRRAMKTEFVPELHEFLDDSPVDTYPYHKTFDEARMDPCLVLHTTGSTGLPKPITWKNANLATYEAWRTIPPVSGYVPTTVVYQEARRAYTSMPLYHTSGINAGITWALLLGVTLVYGYPGVVPNADYADQMHIHGNVDATMGAPSIYEDLSRDPDSLSRLNKLHYVVASGAPLSQAAGAAISKHTRVISNLGSTETACLQRLAPAIDDWSYFYWHPTHSGIQMREFEGGLFELLLVREPGLELYQGIFATFPDIKEWSMSDLYERHPDPEKPFLYRYVGRRDDVIVLSNGEKVAPALMEAALNASPLVRGAMVVGRGKFQPAALLDLHGDLPSSWRGRQQVASSLRSFIDEANKHAPAHGKLDRHHVLFADPERPVCYLGQGKIQRHRTYKVYEEDIERLYRELEDGQNGVNGVHSPTSASDDVSEQSMARYISGIIGEIAGIRGIAMDRDLFEAGVDSLQVMRLATEIRLTFGGHGARPFTGRDIYANPTIGSLATFLVERTRQRSSNGHFGDRVNGTTLEQLRGSTRVDSVAEMTSLLDKYAATLPRPSTKSRYRPTEGITVLMTGSTGSLGSYILDTLYHDTNISRIICLNRCPDAAERHARSGKSRGLSPLSPTRVDFFKADLSRSRLGLSEEVYRGLVGSVTHIIHNQWPVNFNWPLSSFEPHIKGVRNLIRLSSHSAHDAFILFVSSVSAVGAWKGPGPAPEEPMDDMSVAAPMGYGRSKLVAECLLDEAAKVSAVRSACCRVGIVAGPVESRLGMWNKREYIPSIIVSSAFLGAFPASFESRNTIDWLPVDRVPGILLEIMKSVSDGRASAARETGVFHVINPKVQSWSGGFAKGVVHMFKQEDMRLVTFPEWLALLRESTENPIDVEINPAVRLIDFLDDVGAEAQGPRTLETERAESASKALGGVGAVNRAWVRNWIRQWGIGK